MELKISKGNSKLGSIFNYSLPPGITCGAVPCFEAGCYARKSWNQYPNVRKAWQKNLDLYRNDPVEFFDQLYEFLVNKKPERFRIHVGGDLVDEPYWYHLAQVLRSVPDTQFLMFTKRYDYPLGLAPENLALFLSTWPGYPLPSSPLPKTWLEEDPRKPDTYFRCPGECGACDYQCWENKHHDIVFPRH